jgi:hypothetical protein
MHVARPARGSEVFDTLLVLGSMTMMLLVFSLLTKISPVSLATPAEQVAMRNTAPVRGSDNSLKMGTTASLLVAMICKWLQRCEREYLLGAKVSDRRR